LSGDGSEEEEQHGTGAHKRKRASSESEDEDGDAGSGSDVDSLVSDHLETIEKSAILDPDAAETSEGRRPLTRSALRKVTGDPEPPSGASSRPTKRARTDGAESDEAELSDF
jgi:hypothetical protein